MFKQCGRILVVKCYVPPTSSSAPGMQIAGCSSLVSFVASGKGCYPGNEKEARAKFLASEF